MSQDLADRTLYHLSASGIAEGGQLIGPADTNWAALLAAIMEGLERGWVCIAITVVALSAWGTYLLVFE